MRYDREFLYGELVSKINNLPLIVCISGASCSGKTTLAKDLADKFYTMKPVILCEDSWYKDLRDIHRGILGFYDMESLNSFCVEEFYQDVIDLIEKGYTKVPNYDIATNTRKSKENSVNKRDFIILEGLHTIDIFKNLDEKYNVVYVYLDTQKTVCANRRSERDNNLFNIQKNKVFEHYDKVIYKNYKKYIELQKDIVKLKKNRGFILE